MLHPSIEKHRRGLNRFGRMIGIMGWLLVIVTGVWVSMKIGEYKTQVEKWDELKQEGFFLVMRITSTFFLGLFSIGLGQFIQFLLGEKQPSRLLRYGHIVLFLVAVVKFLLSFGYAGFAIVNWNGMQGYDLFAMTFLFPFYRLIYGVILVGLGVALHHVLPMVDESKTLA